MDTVLGVLQAMRTIAAYIPLHAEEATRVNNAIDTASKAITDFNSGNAPAIKGDLATFFSWVTHHGNQPGTPQSRAVAMANNAAILAAQFPPQPATVQTIVQQPQLANQLPTAAITAAIAAGALQPQPTIAAPQYLPGMTVVPDLNPPPPAPAPAPAPVYAPTPVPQIDYATPNTVVIAGRTYVLAN